jgi:hypothetical protein
MKKIWLFLLFLISYLLTPNLYFVRAERLTSPNYRILFGNINIGGKEGTSTGYRLDSSLGQNAAKKFISTGYIVKAGFQYIHTLYRFAFSLSDISIELGTVVPNTPATGQLVATISHRGQGYEVKVIEDHPMRVVLGANEIADTVCNGGAQTCTTTSAAPWTSASAYGFGYNATGNDISADFTDATYFRPFPNEEAPASAVTFMSSNAAARNRQATVTFKLNVSPLQGAGTYQTVVNFIAVPKY